MIRVKFDHDYIDGLDDYYHRNECIREQQYLSPPFDNAKPGSKT